MCQKTLDIDILGTNKGIQSPTMALFMNSHISASVQSHLSFFTGSLTPPWMQIQISPSNVFCYKAHCIPGMTQGSVLGISLLAHMFYMSAVANYMCALWLMEPKETSS